MKKTEAFDATYTGFSLPRLMIAGTGSGCGKTTITCGILAAIKQRGIKLAAAKCGPDYIDPMFHEQICGVSSVNLDLYFVNEHIVRERMCENAKGADLLVMEGVMGFYDGYRTGSTTAGSYDLARVTEAPTVLVVDCRGMAVSVLAVIKGFLEYRSDNTICGVILNRVSPAVGKELKEQIERTFPIRVLGRIPKTDEFFLPGRHLGLVTPGEISDIRSRIKKLGEIISRHVSIEGLLELAKTAPPVRYRVPAPKCDIREFCQVQPEREREALLSELKKRPPRIAVARDAAFCFYYRDNLSLLRELGGELVEFSPLADEKLPENTDGILLGGGYPEVFAGELSENVSMRTRLKEAVERGVFCVAECGGFLYLHENLEAAAGGFYPMAGLIAGHAYRTEHLVRFGYVFVEAKKDNVIRGKAHEFHYWESENNGRDGIASKQNGKQWECMHITNRMMAGFPHFYYYSSDAVPLVFLRQCLQNRRLRGE